MLMLKNALTLVLGILATLAVFAWTTGRASCESISVLAIGLLFVSVFYFVALLLIRMPFQRLRTALASLLIIVLVSLGVLYALPLIDAYRNGYDVSKSLFHPIVFGSLGLAIVLLNQRNHRRY